MERSQRLRKGNEFDSVYKKGTVVGGPLLVLRHIPNDVGEVRWGFAVGKRLAKQAVLRNRTKRRLKAAAERANVIPGIDIVVTARNGAIEARYADLERALFRALAKARLLAGSTNGTNTTPRARGAQRATVVGAIPSGEPAESAGERGTDGESMRRGSGQGGLVLGTLRARPQKDAKAKG